MKIPVEISSSLITYHGQQAILSIARNITERKKAEQSLVKSEEKFRTLAEQNPNDGIVTGETMGAEWYYVNNEMYRNVQGTLERRLYSSEFNFISLNRDQNLLKK